MPFPLQYHLLKGDQQEKYLDIIMRNRSMYEDFLAFAEKRFQGENVRFLKTMYEIPWGGHTPMSSDMSRGVYATYIREGSFMQVNLDAGKVAAIESKVEQDEPVDWVPAVKEIKRLLRQNMLIVNYLAEREKAAQQRA